MFKRIFMVVCAALLLTANVSFAQDYKYFSLDLPSDWSAIDGPSEDSDGVYTVLFGKSDRSVVVSIVVSPTDGEDAKSIATTLAPTLGATEAPAEHQGQYGFPFVSKGNKGFAVVSADTKQKLFFLLAITGEIGSASPILDGMKSTKYPQLMIK